MLTFYQSTLIVDIPFDAKDRFRLLEKKFKEKNHIDLDEACNILNIKNKNYNKSIITYVNIHLNGECYLVITGEEIEIANFLKQLSEIAKLKNYVISRRIYEILKRTIDMGEFGVMDSSIQMLFKFTNRFDRENMLYGQDWIYKLYDMFYYKVDARVVLDFENEKEFGKFIEMLGLTVDEAKRIQSCTTIPGFFCVFNFDLGKPLQQYLAEVMDYSDGEEID